MIKQNACHSLNWTATELQWFFSHKLKREFNEFNILCMHDWSDSLSMVWSVLLLGCAEVVKQGIGLSSLGPILPERKVFAPLRHTALKQLLWDGEVVNVCRGSLHRRQCTARKESSFRCWRCCDRAQQLWPVLIYVVWAWNVRRCSWRYEQILVFVLSSFLTEVIFHVCKLEGLCQGFHQVFVVFSEKAKQSANSLPFSQRFLRPEGAKVTVVVFELVLQHFEEGIHRRSHILIEVAMKTPSIIVQISLGPQQPRTFVHSSCILAVLFFLSRSLLSAVVVYLPLK